MRKRWAHYLWLRTTAENAAITGKVKFLEDYIRTSVNAGADKVLLPRVCSNEFEELHYEHRVG